MRLTEVGAPVSSADGKYGELRNDDGGADGSGYFFRSLDPEANMAFRVANDDDGLESCTLTSTGLLLDWFDLYMHIIGLAPNPLKTLLPPHNPNLSS